MMLMQYSDISRSASARVRRGRSRCGWQTVGRAVRKAPIVSHIVVQRLARAISVAAAGNGRATPLYRRTHANGLHRLRASRRSERMTRRAARLVRCPASPPNPPGTARVRSCTPSRACSDPAPHKPTCHASGCSIIGAGRCPTLSCSHWCSARAARRTTSSSIARDTAASVSARCEPCSTHSATRFRRRSAASARRKTAQLLAVSELARRASPKKLRNRPLMDSPEAVEDYLSLLIGTRPYEVFVCLFLDARHRLIC